MLASASTSSIITSTGTGIRKLVLLLVLINSTGAGTVNATATRAERNIGIVCLPIRFCGLECRPAQLPLVALRLQEVWVQRDITMKALTRCQAYMKVSLRDVGNIIDESD